MVSPYLVLGGVLYRITGPPWRLQRSRWPDLGWDDVSASSSSPLLLPGDLPDFVTSNGDVVMVDEKVSR